MNARRGRLVLAMLAAFLSSVAGRASAAREYPLLSGPGDQSVLGLYRNIVLLADDPSQGGAFDLLYYDLYTQRLQPVPVLTGARVVDASVWEDLVVWTDGKDYRDEGYYADTDIYATRLATGDVFAVCEHPAEQFNASVGDRLIVWSDERNQVGQWSNTDVYYLDLTSGESGPVTTAAGDQGSMFVPQSAGRIVVWDDTTIDGNATDLYGCDLDTQEEFPIEVGAGRSTDGPSIWGDHVAFDYLPEEGSRRVYVFDLVSRTLSPLSAEGSAGLHASMCASIVVWTDFRNYGSTWTDIYAYDLAQAEEFPVCTATRFQDLPRVYGDLVIWSDDRNYEDGVSGLDVYACDLERNPFWDVRTDEWSFSAVSAASQADVARGYEDRSYRPKQCVTRAQMAAYISRAMLGGDANVPPPSGDQVYPDIPRDHWAYRYIQYASAQSVVTGYDDGSYHPDDVVDRAQMAVFVGRARGWVVLGDDMAVAPELFPDVPAGHWAGTAIEACVEHGVVQGYDDGLYRPDAVVTRDQMAVYIARAFELPM